MPCLFKSLIVLVLSRPSALHPGQPRAVYLAWLSSWQPLASFPSLSMPLVRLRLNSFVSVSGILKNLASLTDHSALHTQLPEALLFSQRKLILATVEGLMGCPPYLTPKYCPTRT